MAYDVDAATTTDNGNKETRTNIRRKKNKEYRKANQKVTLVRPWSEGRRSEKKGETKTYGERERDKRKEGKKGEAATGRRCRRRRRRRSDDAIRRVMRNDVMLTLNASRRAG